MKIYVLMIARHFPTFHQRAGHHTYFAEKIRTKEKIHTIRCNFDLWQNRIKEVNAGEAVISVREWTGKPYNSIQTELFQLKDNEVGFQKVHLNRKLREMGCVIIDSVGYELPAVAKNDGLLPGEFSEWFKNHDSFAPMIMIHFTPFRYI